MILSWAPNKTSTTPSVISPSNPSFIIIQIHRLGVLLGATCTHGCKHIASSCFYRGLSYCGLSGLAQGRSGQGYKPSSDESQLAQFINPLNMWYHRMRGTEKCAFQVAISSDE